MTYDINRNKLFYNYKVVCKNLELAPFYQYLEYLKHYYDDVEDEIEIDFPYDRIEEEYLTFYQNKESEYSSNPLTKYRRLAFSYLKNRVNATSVFKLGQINQKQYDMAEKEVESYISKTRLSKYKAEKDIEMINGKIQSLIFRNKRISSAVTSFSKSQLQLNKLQTSNRMLTGRPIEEIYDEHNEELKQAIEIDRQKQNNPNFANGFRRNNFIANNGDGNVSKYKDDYDFLNKRKSEKSCKSQAKDCLNDKKSSANIGNSVTAYLKNTSFIEPVLTIANNQNKKRLRPITAFQISKPYGKVQSAFIKPLTSKNPVNLTSANPDKENVDGNTGRVANPNHKSILNRPASEFLLKKNVRSQYANRLVRCQSVLEIEKGRVNELRDYCSAHKVILGDKKLRSALTIPDLLIDANKPKLLAKSGSTLLKVVVPKRIVRRKKKKTN